MILEIKGDAVYDFRKRKGMQFRGVFFTELVPPDSRMERTNNAPLLCFSLTKMEAVAEKTKTFLKLSILQVCE